MIPNCQGCQVEWNTACEYIKQGFHFATTKERTGLGERKHLFMLIVNDKGKWIAG